LSAFTAVCLVFVGVSAASAIASSLLILSAGARKKLLPSLISYATGSLLATALLGTIPEANHLHQFGIGQTMECLLVGLVFYFLLEKYVMFRHAHDEPGARNEIVLPGDAIHNLLDGAIIGFAFQRSLTLGFASMMSILLHQIPQEVHEVSILIDSGVSKRKAYFLNYLTSLPAAPGTAVAYLVANEFPDLAPYFLSISAAGLIYVSVSDFAPGVQKFNGLREGLQQVFLLLFGVLTVFLIRF